MKGANRQVKDKIGRTPLDLAKDHLNTNTSDSKEKTIIMKNIVDHLVIHL